MTLDKGDCEIVERIVYKNSDDIAVSIARSFERLEERIDALESRVYGRIGETEDRVEASRQDISDDIGTLRDEIREMIRKDNEEGL